MEDEIYDIVTDLLREDITKNETIAKLLDLLVVSLSLRQKHDEAIDRNDLLEKYVEHLANMISGKQSLVEETADAYKNALVRCGRDLLNGY